MLCSTAFEILNRWTIFMTANEAVSELWIQIKSPNIAQSYHKVRSFFLLSFSIFTKEKKMGKSDRIRKIWKSIQIFWSLKVKSVFFLFNVASL